MPDNGRRTVQFREHFADARPPRDIERSLIVEAPIAIEINGIGYAVMMATPTELADYATGFLLSEQIIADPADVLSVDPQEVEDGGWMLRVMVSVENAAPLLERARLRLSEGSCGLCGIESLEQVLRPLAPVTARLDVPEAALFAAANALRDHQALGRATGAAHAAAFCDADGRIIAVREDVGRHNSLDKLIGALARRGVSPAEGFILLTARCSFELVQKTIIAGCPVLATISAASTLAVDHARRHGVRLFSLLRQDSVLETGGNGVEPD